jgi:zinc transport system permease protein
MEMFHYEFMQRAFWAGGLIAVIAPILGVYLMLRRQALMADTLSHVSLAGVAVGAMLRMSPVVAGFLFAVAAAVLIEQLRRSFRAYSEMSVAVMMTSGLALAVVLMNIDQGLNKSFSSYLFGSIVAVGGTELGLIAAVTAIAAVYFLLLRRPLYLLVFDEDSARVGGVSTRLLSLSFSILTGMTVSVAMPIVGVLLVSALMVLPAALALRVSRGFASAVSFAAGIGLAGMFSGLTVSYYVNTPPGGTVALILLLFLGAGIGLQKARRRLKRRAALLQPKPTTHHSY